MAPWDSEINMASAGCSLFAFFYSCRVDSIVRREGTYDNWPEWLKVYGAAASFSKSVKTTFTLRKMAHFYLCSQNICLFHSEGLWTPNLSQYGEDFIPFQPSGNSQLIKLKDPTDSWSSWYVFPATTFLFSYHLWKCYFTTVTKLFSVVKKFLSN